MNNILLYISNGLIIISFFCYGLLFFFKNKKISEENGFDITKDIISQYDSINVIENTGNMTYYNLQREVIKLSHKCYYGSGLNTIALSLFEAGISSIDKQNNKYIKLFKKIISNLKMLYLFPIITMIVNALSYTVMDAKIGIIIIAVASIITYIYISILTEANEWVSKKIKNIKTISKKNLLEIVKYNNNIINFNKIMFIGELIGIIRMIAIIINFKI